MEARIFARIDEEHDARPQAVRREKRRMAGWVSVAAAAAIVTAIAVPSTIIATQKSGAETIALPAVDTGFSQNAAGSEPEMAQASEELARQSADSSAYGADTAMAGGAADSKSIDASIITTASATLTSKDLTKSSQQITDYAVSVGGLIESQSLGTGDDPYMYPELTSKTPVGDGVPTYGNITMRVPSDKLTAAVTALEGFGTVTNTNIMHSDVTTAVSDANAQVESMQASVARLKDLMAKATSVGDLLAAEGALAERQAMLDSALQMQEYYANQVEMSSLHIQLTLDTPASTKPEGFSSGISAGWDGLIASLNGIIVAAGFIVPWLGVLAVILLIVWLIRRARRRPATQDGSTEQE